MFQTDRSKVECNGQQFLGDHKVEKGEVIDNNNDTEVDGDAADDDDDNDYMVNLTFKQFSSIIMLFAAKCFYFRNGFSSVNNFHSINKISSNIKK